MSEPSVQEAVEAVKGLNQVFTEFKALNDENQRKRDVVLEEQMKAMQERMDQLQAVADRAVLEAKRRSNMAGAGDPEADLDRKAQQWLLSLDPSRRGRVTSFGAAEMAQYKAAFCEYVRSGDMTEGKAMTVGSDPQGGYLVPPDLSGRMVEKAFETSPIRAYASVQSISGDTLVGTYSTDEASVTWTGEQQVATESTPTVGQYSISLDEVSAQVRASQRLLDDALVDVEAWIVNKIGDAIARAENAACVTGNGIAKPRGFLEYPNSTDLKVGIEQFATGASGAFAATPNAADVLLSAIYGLKSQYRRNGTWFMNSTTMGLARKMKDSEGRYLWSEGFGAGQPPTLLGYPVAAFEDMPDPSAGSLSIAFGDMRQAYQMVDRPGVSILRDPYSAKPNVLMYARKRIGGAVINGEALKLIKFATS